LNLDDFGLALSGSELINSFQTRSRNSVEGGSLVGCCGE
jgi:hypothetical protein